MQQLRIFLISLIVVFVLLTHIALPHTAHAAKKPRLAFDDGSDIYIWDRTKTIKITQRRDEQFDNYFTPIWSNDGNLAFLYVQGGPSVHTSLEVNPDVYVWDGNSTTKVGTISYEGDQTIGYNPMILPTWSNDGRLAFNQVIDESSHIYVWDGTISKDILPGVTSNAAPVWSSDGRLAFTGKSTDGNQEVYVWDGKTVVNVSNDPADDYFPVWGPNGKLAFISSRGESGDQIYIWDGTSVIKISDVPSEVTTRMNWNSEGEFVYVAHSDFKQTLWSPKDVIIWDGTRSIEVIKNVQVMSTPQWTPDNKLLLLWYDESINKFIPSVIQTGGRHLIAKAAIWDREKITPLTNYPVVLDSVIDQRAQQAFPVNNPTWSRDGRLALMLLREKLVSYPEDNGEGNSHKYWDVMIHVWQTSGLIPIDQSLELTPSQPLWSSDGWLAWQTIRTTGDSFCCDMVYVWDGESVRAMSQEPFHYLYAPAWEPIGD